MGQAEWKRNAGRKAADLVEDDMLVGLGSGSTLAEVVKALGERGSKADFVSSSVVTQQMAVKLGLNVVSLKRNTRLDIAIDGADEVDPNFAVIKGGGGAHTREKIVASAGKEFFMVVDKTKLVEKLGERNPVPVEVVPFSHEYIMGLLEDFGGECRLRKSPHGGPFVTDNGNYIIDVKLEGIEEPAELERDLNRVPGVVENGIFADFVDRVYVGYEGGCKVLESKEDFSEFVGN